MAHGVVFEFFETSPAKMTRLLGNNENISGMKGYDIKHFVDSFDWKFGKWDCVPPVKALGMPVSQFRGGARAEIFGA